MKSMSRLIQAFPVQTILTLVAAFMAVLNVWISAKNKPYDLSLQEVQYKVQALELESNTSGEYLERFIVVEQQVKQSSADLIEVKTDVKSLKDQGSRIETKLDFIGKQ